MIDELIAVRTHSGGIAWLPRSLALDFVELGHCTLVPAPDPVLVTWGAAGENEPARTRLTRRG